MHWLFVSGLPLAFSGFRNTQRLASVLSLAIVSASVAAVADSSAAGRPNASGSATAAEQAEAAKADPVDETTREKNSNVVDEITKPDRLVEGADGSMHPSTGPAKPVETWMSACPPHAAGDQASAKKAGDCKKPSDQKR